MGQDWLEIYRNVDDDALAALASAGLVRRAAKDVEAGKVQWEAPPEARQGRVRADDQLVLLTGAGPAKASCDCPAPGICKHILAASMWLRDAERADTGTDSAPSDALSEVMALDPAVVFKAAGVAATRKAAALYAASPAVIADSLPGVLLIQLPELDIACRYIAGGGFAGIVSELPAASRAAAHLLAIAVAWRLHGRDVAWPAAATAGQASPATADALPKAEREFLERLRQLVLETCRGGWAHVSEVMPAQLRAFALSARIESFPRLAGMLRTLAGTTELLVRRDLGADERQAIRLAARILALCEALEHSGGEALAQLRGRARRDFESGQALELVPLGAHWWEQRGGARGLTISFWDHAGQGVMQAVLARRDAADPGFSRAGAWSAHSLWQGAGTAQALSRGTIALEQVRVSGDNRLSLSAETRARTLPSWLAGDKRWQAAGYDDWRTLADAVRLRAGLRGEAIDCVLLKPSTQEAPRLDEVRQVFDWTLRDRHGAPLRLRLSCAPVHHRRIANIAAWQASGAVIAGVLARLDTDVDGGCLEPVSLVISDDGVLKPVALDYEAPAKAPPPSLMQRITRMLQPAPSTPARPVFAPQAIRFDWIDALLTILENKAMTGRLHLVGEDRDGLVAVQGYVHAIGIDLVAQALERYLAAPDQQRGLMLIYLCQTCAELDTRFIHG